MCPAAVMDTDAAGDRAGTSTAAFSVITSPSLVLGDVVADLTCQRRSRLRPFPRQVGILNT